MVFDESLGSVSLVAEGRGWKYFALAKFWPISEEPTTTPSFTIRLPLACWGRRSCATPVMASG